MKPDELDKALAKMAKSYQKMAVALREKTIGTHVLAIAARDGEISIENLRKSLHAEIKNAPSNHGECAPELDLKLLTAEAALVHLLTLLPPDAA